MNSEMTQYVITVQRAFRRRTNRCFSRFCLPSDVNKKNDDECFELYFTNALTRIMTPMNRMTRSDFEQIYYRLEWFDVLIEPALVTVLRRMKPLVRFV
jgi:hypothetical protein